jgi:hypothetical protein
VTDEGRSREPLADESGYPFAISTESLALGLVSLSLRKCPGTPDADSVCNTAVTRPSVAWLQSTWNQPAQQLITTGILDNNLWMTQIFH